jgi:hypothetical protein
MTLDRLSRLKSKRQALAAGTQGRQAAVPKEEPPPDPGRQVAVPAAGPRPIPAEQAAPPPQPPPPKPAPKVECEPRLILTYGCGCRIGARYLQGSDCPACRAAKRRARPPRQRKPRLDLRLPDNAAISALYDASTTSWTGSLSIPGAPLFEASQSGVVPLLRELDRMYRQHIEAQATQEG